MRNQGMRVLDSAEMEQLVWLLLPATECPDESSERRVIAGCFLVPHEPWNWPPAFANPVRVRRTRRRILFSQHAGVVE